jgi:hypothetical protein
MDNSIKLDMKDQPFITCKGGNALWDTSLMFKRLSPLMSPTGKEELIPAEVIICKKCGKVPKFFYDKAKEIPEELRSTCENSIINP